MGQNGDISDLHNHSNRLCHLPQSLVLTATQKKSLRMGKLTAAAKTTNAKAVVGSSCKTPKIKRSIRLQSIS